MGRVVLVLKAQPAHGAIRRVQLTAVVAAVVAVVAVVAVMAVVTVVVVAVVGVDGTLERFLHGQNTGDRLHCVAAVASRIVRWSVTRDKRHADIDLHTE